MILKKVINDANNSNYQAVLDEIGNNAANNGLTAEILNEILSDNA